jgi:predicted nuclease of predicted toxin-antitoxin system
MRLLFDENLSRRLMVLLADECPGSSHPLSLEPE